MDWEKIVTLFLVLTFSLTIHEAAHGLFAWIGGDRTAKDKGLVTLNPIPHMRREPFGMVLIPIAIIIYSQGTACFGGASAPIDPYWSMRHPRRAALMSVAGPLANVLLAGVGFAIMYFIGKPYGNVEETVFDTAHIVFLLNLLLAIINLIPLPPFDGAGVVGGLVPAMDRLFRSYAKIPLYFIISMVIAWQLINNMMWPAYYQIIEWLPYPPTYR